MRQFDVLPNPSDRSRVIAPYLVVLQSHHLNAMPSVIVAPLLRYDEQAIYSELSIVVTVLGEEYILSTGELAAIGSRSLPRAVANLRDHEDAIRRALDRLFTGF